jgi:hypothetical protein
MGDEDMKDLLHKKLMDVFDKEYPPHKYVPRNDNDLKNYIISLTPFLHENSLYHSLGFEFIDNS